ncbi:TetR/AcrR family transcriptional regulator C-terminal domain-containing protein [Lacticaseibacillus hulanensis]|uniref:TetR/AcrR family transcriptional regulator C-terminal domain-containing protein n=1 Tax=Lacticaseibacillus hulanensis TaxID=2493111 RepID=UPI0013E40F0F|nr:TetR/AcrR family transcriptional regulator C-terminal domain-containing protein [Lacticaseibacillus hulanensis]
MHQKTVATEARIKQSFITLLQAKTFEQVSVSDIAQLAGINRGTFYLHYVDKYALLNHYEDDLIGRAQQFFRDDSAETMMYQPVTSAELFTYPVVADIVGLVQSEFALFKVLFGPNGDPRFEVKLQHILRDAISQRLVQLKGKPTLTKYIPETYAWELVISGLVSIMKTWLQSPQPAEPRRVCDIIMKTRFLSPYDLLGVTD